MAEMGRRAFDWLLAHQDELFAVSDDRKRLKYMGELALVAGTLVDEMPEARAMLERAWVELMNGDMIAHLAQHFPVAITTYLPFVLAGIRSVELEDKLRAMTWHAEHPFSRYAIAVVLARLAIPAPWPERDIVLANRFFETPTSSTPPIRAELLAHAIMWRTEMGKHPLDAVTQRAYREASTQWHPILCERALLDPLGEIVIADRCAGMLPPVASVALLTGSQRADGAMPWRPNESTTELAELYHPTCVAALAGSSRLQGVHHG